MKGEFYKVSFLFSMMAIFLLPVFAEKSFSPRFEYGNIEKTKGGVLAVKAKLKKSKSENTTRSHSKAKLPNKEVYIPGNTVKTISLPPSISNVEVLIVGGGGGGGRARVGSGAGGGGGQVVTRSGLTISTDITVTVGAGGAGGTGTGTESTGSINAPNTISQKIPYSGSNGSQSSFGSYIAMGGGGSQLRYTDGNQEQGGNAYGSTTSTVYTGGTKIEVKTGNDWYYAGGGGAGSGGNGGNGNSNSNVSNGGAGGVGVSNSFRTGSALFYSGGGGGSGASGVPSLIGPQGAGGSGVGGDGVAGTTTGNNGIANSGGGGGGSWSGNAGSGGSGIVVVRYAASAPMATGGTITSYSSGGTTYQVHTFTSSGTFAPAASAPTASVISGTTSICNGSSANLSVAITGGTSPFTVVYSNGTTNTTVNSYISGSNISVSPTANTTYTIVSVTDASGEVGTGNSGSAVVTVNATNTVGTASSTPTLCINSAITNITHATTGATGIGTATGLPSGVTAAWSSNTITISGTPTASGTFNYSIPLTGGCGSMNATGTITVNQNTAGVASSSPSVCINTALTNITHTTSGATGIGTATGLPTGVSAAWSSNTITISGTPTVAGTFSYSIPLTGGCGTVSATGTITVNELPIFLIQPSSAAQSICAGAESLNVEVDPGSGIVASYKWYSNASSSTSGGSLLVTNTTTSSTNSYSPTSTAYYYTTITNSNGCVATSTVSGLVTINAAPSISSQPSSSIQSVCINATPTNLSVTVAAGSGTISTYKWYSNTSNSTSGGTLISTTVGTSTTNSYTPSTASTGTKYYYCVVTNSNGCSATSTVSGAITVLSASVGGAATAAAVAVSIGDNTTISLSGYTGTIQWQQSADGSSGWSNVSGGSGPTLATYTTAALSATTYYKALVTNGGCAAASSNNVTVSVSVTSVSANILVVGAGGSGGAHRYDGGGPGGGGGGGVAYITGTTLSNATYTITVAGTTGGKTVTGTSGCGSTGGKGLEGGNSTFTGNSKTATAYGGGGGGGNCDAYGTTGGSGGGGTFGYSGSSGTKGTTSGFSTGTVNLYGNTGGTSPNINNGGGGGGASSAGSNLTGGQGISISITGTAQVYGSGGGGNSNSGAGGSGGTNAGNGAYYNSSDRTGIDAPANFGGGGGGMFKGDQESGRGGSGVVIISYASPVAQASGGTITSYSSGGVTYQVHTFTSSGSFVLNVLPVFYITSTGIATTVCTSASDRTTSLAYSASGGSPTSYTIDWNAAANTAGFADQGTTNHAFVAGGGTITDIAIPAGVAAGTYTGTMTISNGSSTTTQSISLAVGSASGTISGAGTVTTGTNSTTLTLSGNTGSIQWQSSVDNATYSTIVSATSSSYTATNLTATTFYKAVVTNGSCASATTSAASITVSLPSTSFGVTGSTTANTISNNVASVVDPAIVVTANGTVSGFTVTISSDYTDGDVLGYTGSLPSGVTASSFNTTTRSINFTGTASPADWQTLLRTVTITSTSNCYPTNRKVSFLPSNKLYNYFNGHYYEYVSTLLSWSAAKADAASRSFYGRQGYLVTITSEAENNFIFKLIGLNSWIGLSCVHTEINSALGYNRFSSTTYGQFYWVTGPEKGTLVSTGLRSPVGASGVYNNWLPTEPNNYRGWNENSGHMYNTIPGGYWNDYAGSTTIAYIVEFGDSQGDDESSDISFTRDIIISGSPVGSVSGADTVCNGTNSTTLTFSGTGTIQRWEYSTDNFVTTGTTVASTATTLTATNLSSSRYYRAVVNTSGCTNLASSSALITVVTSTAGSITATSADVCAGGSAALTLNGNSGDIQKWQVSTSSDFTSGVTDISITTNTLSHTLSSNGTYYFRAAVLNSTCTGGTAVYTEGYPVTVTTGTPPVGGTVSSVSFCGGSNAGTLSLSGSTGTSYQWQVSTDGGVVYTNASSTSTSQSYTGISATTKYRVLVTNGSCGSVYSSVGAITIGGTSGAQWTGGTSTDWGNTANWCGYIIGDDGLDVTISATATYAPTLDRDRAIGNLNFNSSSKSVTLGNYTLTVSSITGASSSNYIKTTGTGKLKVSIGNGITTSLPVGNDAYNPVSITNNNSSSDYFSARVLNEVYANSLSGTLISNGRVQRTWDISKTNANTGSGVNFVFNWNAGETTALTVPSLHNYTGGSWVIQSGTTSYSSKSLTYTGYTGTISYFAMLQGVFTWMGSASDNYWSTDNNWSTGSAPGAGAAIVINTGIPQLDIDYSVTGSLTLSGTATLTVSPGKTLSIPFGGIADFGGKLVTFMSDATGTAQLGTVLGSLSNATNVVVERHIPASKRAFRFLGSPVTTTTTIRQNWMEGATPGVVTGYPYTTTSVYNPKPGYGTLITGAGGNANGFDATQTLNPSLSTFNNSTGAWVTSTNTSATIAAGSAHRLLVRGDRSYNINSSIIPVGGATILRTTGTIAQGELTTGIQLPALSQAANGWSLVGNPYQAVVDMASINVVKNNLTPYYYVWDPRVGTRGAYVSFNMNLPANGSNNTKSGVSRFAQPGQAFFVQNTTAGSNSIVFKETAKGAASNKTATFAKNNTTAGMEDGYTIDATTEKAETLQPQSNYASLSTFLYYTDSLAAGAEAMDAARVLFGDQFSDLVDINDGLKFSNLDETMAIKQGSSLLSMELRTMPDRYTKLPLNITQYIEKKYTMRLLWDEKLNTDTLVAYLRDNYTNKETEVKKIGNTDVEYLLDADARSSAVDRFEIFFKSTNNQVTAVINYDNGQYIKIYPNPVQSVLKVDFDLGQQRKVDIKLYDMMGRLVIDRPGLRKGSTLTMTGLSKGIYNVKVWGIDGKLLMTEKIIKE